MESEAYKRAPHVDYFQLGRQVLVTFVEAYGPTDTVPNTREQEDAFWAGLDSAVSRLPMSGYLFVSMYANARNGVRIEEKGCKVTGAYGKDTRVNDSATESRFCYLRVTTSLP